MGEGLEISWPGTDTCTVQLGATEANYGARPTAI